MSGASRWEEASAPDTVPASRAPITPSAGSPRRSSFRDLVMVLLWLQPAPPACPLGWCSLGGRTAGRAGTWPPSRRPAPPRLVRWGGAPWGVAPPEGPVPGPSGAAPTHRAAGPVAPRPAPAGSRRHDADHPPGVVEGSQRELERRRAVDGDDPDERRCICTEGDKDERRVAEAIQGDRRAGGEGPPRGAQSGGPGA